MTTHETMFSKQELKNIETHLLNDEGKLFLVVNNVSGIHVEAIFTSKENANKYIIRECLNSSLEEYDYLSFQQFVKNNLYYYRMIDITDLSLKLDMPIYVIQSGNYNVYDNEFHQHLTNDLELWKKYTKNVTESWIKKCIVKIDPLLEDYDECYLRDEKDEKKE
jgi:hypothetical protein